MWNQSLLTLQQFAARPGSFSWQHMLPAVKLDGQQRCRSALTSLAANVLPPVRATQRSEAQRCSLLRGTPQQSSLPGCAQRPPPPQQPQAQPASMSSSMVSSRRGAPPSSSSGDRCTVPRPAHQEEEAAAAGPEPSTSRSMPRQQGQARTARLRGGPEPSASMNVTGTALLHLKAH